MFCVDCGAQLPEDAGFCMRCGRSLTPRMQPPAVQAAHFVAQPKKSAHWTAWVLLAILALVLYWGWENAERHPENPSALPSSLSQMILPIRHTLIITNTAVSVSALAYSYYKFTVPPGSTNISVDGRFAATGGIGNDIEVYILNRDSFVNFQNHHDSPTYYNSGKVTENEINAVLPGAGTYYLVLNNNFSLITPKAVQVSATLRYTD